MEYLGQGVGLLAAAIGFYSLTFKDDKKLLFLQIITNFLLVIHFLLLGFPSSAMVAGLVTLRILAAYKFNNNYTYSFFMVACFIQGYIMFINGTQYFEYFGLVATFIATHVYFKLTKIPMRVGFIMGGICWCVTAYYTNSYSVFLMNFVGCLIHLSTIYRMKKDQEKILANA